MSLKPESHHTYSLSGFILGQAVAGHEEKPNKNQARSNSIPKVQIETKLTKVSSLISTTMILTIKISTKKDLFD